VDSSNNLAYAGASNSLLSHLGRKRIFLAVQLELPFSLNSQYLIDMEDVHRNSGKPILAALALLAAMLLGCNKDSPQPIFSPNGSDTTGHQTSDFNPPQPVTDPQLTFSLPDGKAYLEWTAPYDDTDDEPVARYEVRFSYTSQFKFLWDLGIIHSAPPKPKPPGEPESLIIDAPARGRDLYAAIKAFDESNNESSVHDYAFIHVPGYTLSGQCLDALTHQPVQNLAVKVTANYVQTLATDVDGRFANGDLTAGTAVVSISTGEATCAYHHLGKSFGLTDDTHDIYYCIAVQPTDSPHYKNLLELFKVLTRTDSPPFSTILATWRRRPVRCYVPDFVNDSGVDYHAVTLAALQRWTDKAGTELFALTGTPPDTGIVFKFKPPTEMGIHLGLTSHTYDPEKHPVTDVVSVVNTFNSSFTLYKVMLHEIGHTIQFGHVPYSSFIMYESQPIPDDISDDEANVLRLLLALPVRLDMANYDENYP
jgi:hypothetical protein